MDSKVITIENLNPGMLASARVMQYVTGGPIVSIAAQIETELRNGVSKPFDFVIKTNIGDAQAMGQKPITFIRQVLALVSYPKLLENKQFADDAKSRAREILSAIEGSTGCSLEAKGMELVRHHVAKFIEKRDGHPADINNIFLCAGASVGIKTCFKLFAKYGEGKRTGIMIPVPQYPLYYALILEFGMKEIPYYLDEAADWELSISELESSIREARNQCRPSAIVVINPGNPTGQVLSRKNMEDIVKFAHKENLFILADEVYQDNVHSQTNKFHSFKKVISEMGPPYYTVELASFHSCSKGFAGECGIRGGYAEILNINEEARTTLLESLSMTTRPSVTAQVVLDTMVNPPKPGEPSYEQFESEKVSILQTLSDRAHKMAEAFNRIPGIKCNPIQGAMYAFPQITVPDKAVAKANSLGVAPDVFYALQLLEQTGICVAPGTQYGQKPGTYHFRTTILPPTFQIEIMLEKLEKFQEKFLDEYK